MSSAKIKRLEQRLTTEMQHKGFSLERALEFVREEFEEYKIESEVRQLLEEAYQNLKSNQQRIDRLSRVNSVRIRREPWYSGPNSPSPSWDAYEAYLKSKGWNDAIPSIDKASTEIVSLLHNPGLPEFECYGLVLGYVQSGKTANMTAVIAKAADAGYRVVIILTGMIEKLRKQTQARIESDLLEQTKENLWIPWTTQDADFTAQPATPGFQFDPTTKNIFVIKKQRDVLQRLIDKLKNTDKGTKAKVPVLVIDDECDQASVNAAARDDQVTTLNRLIRQLMEQFPRHSYLGYTATPFANVLIDPSVRPDEPLNLYPKDFIYTLPMPDGYFGAEKLFGRDLLDAETELADDEELDIIRTIPEEEVPNLAIKKASSHFELTRSAKEAIDYFLIATAVRNERGQRSRHSTMLYHTTHLRVIHRIIADEIREYVRQQALLLDKQDSDYMAELRRIWDRERAKVPPSLYGYSEPEFSNLLPEISDIANQIEVVVVNSESPDVLDYSDSKDHGRRYIAVGGNVISRGLTLEGLVCSFFMRTSKQYDTLLQMGRWFGYRNGYEDLPRVWMTSEMEENFFNLATVEADIREKIRIYGQKEPEVTPMEVAVRIRQVPGLVVTARNKMRHARICKLSFAGDHHQTTHFAHKDESLLGKNWDAAEKLVNDALKQSQMDQVALGHLIRGVNRALIEAFLNEYEIHPTHVGLVDRRAGRNYLLEYIDECKRKNPSDLLEWNVGIIQPLSTKRTTKTGIEGIDTLKLINRSKFQQLANGDADIKALMSRRDITIDMDEFSLKDEGWGKIKEIRKQRNQDRPLLLLYPIDRESEPSPRTEKSTGKTFDSKRTALNAVEHVMGMGILFPNAADNGPSHYIEVRLPELEERDEDEEEEESLQT